MGLYNTIVFNCPDCGSIIGIQTKSGSCNLKVFSIFDAPVEEVKGILGEYGYCEECGKRIIIGENKRKRKDYSYLVNEVD